MRKVSAPSCPSLEADRRLSARNSSSRPRQVSRWLLAATLLVLAGSWSLRSFHAAHSWKSISMAAVPGNSWSAPHLWARANVLIGQVWQSINVVMPSNPWTGIFELGLCFIVAAILLGKPRGAQ